MGLIEIVITVYLFCLAQCLAVLELDRLMEFLSRRRKERSWISSTSA